MCGLRSRRGRYGRSGTNFTDPATGLHRMFQLQTRLTSMRIGMPDGINSVEEECVWSCNRS